MCMPHQSTKKPMTKRVRTSQLPGNEKSQKFRRDVMEPDPDFVDTRRILKREVPQKPTSFWKRLFG